MHDNDCVTIKCYFSSTEIEGRLFSKFFFINKYYANKYYINKYYRIKGMAQQIKYLAGAQASVAALGKLIPF